MPCTKKMSMKSVNVSNMNVKRIKIELQDGPKNDPNGSKVSTKGGPNLHAIASNQRKQNLILQYAKIERQKDQS